MLCKGSKASQPQPTRDVSWRSNGGYFCEFPAGQAASPVAVWGALPPREAGGQPRGARGDSPVPSRPGSLLRRDKAPWPAVQEPLPGPLPHVFLLGPEPRHLGQPGRCFR